MGLHHSFYRCEKMIVDLIQCPADLIHGKRASVHYNGLWDAFYIFRYTLQHLSVLTKHFQ